MLEIKRQAKANPTLPIRAATKSELYNYESTVRNISQGAMLKPDSKSLCFEFKTTTTDTINSKLLFTRGVN